MPSISCKPSVAKDASPAIPSKKGEKNNMFSQFAMSMPRLACNHRDANHASPQFRQKKVKKRICFLKSLCQCRGWPAIVAMPSTPPPQFCHKKRDTKNLDFLIRYVKQMLYSALTATFFGSAARLWFLFPTDHHPTMPQHRIEFAASNAGFDCQPLHHYLYSYGHRTVNTRLPVCSAIFKHRIAWLVLQWVTMRESPVL
jgi:hypothetical protein